MSSGDGGRPPRTRRRYSGISSSDEGVPWAIRRTAEFIGGGQWPVIGDPSWLDPTTRVHRPPPGDHRPLLTGHQPPATDHGPPATDHRPPTTVKFAFAD